MTSQNSLHVWNGYKEKAPIAFAKGAFWKGVRCDRSRTMLNNLLELVGVASPHEGRDVAIVFGSVTSLSEKGRRIELVLVGRFEALARLGHFLGARSASGSDLLLLSRRPAGAIPRRL